MKQQKIRKIAIFSDNDYVLGVSLPKRLNHWENIYITANESGCYLILSSGCKPNTLTFNDIKKHSKVIDKFVL